MAPRVLIAGGYGLVGGNIARHIRTVSQNVELVLAGRSPDKGLPLARGARAVPVQPFLTSRTRQALADAASADLIISALYDPGQRLGGSGPEARGCSYRHHHQSRRRGAHRVDRAANPSAASHRPVGSLRGGRGDPRCPEGSPALQSWFLEASTGATIRPTDVEPGSVYDLPPGESAVHLARGPVSGFGRDPDEPDVYVARLGNRVDRIRVPDGDVVWSSVVEGWFNPATPLADGEDVFVCEGTGAVVCLAREDGAITWRTEVTSSSPLRAMPYRDAGGALVADPLLVGDELLIACGDGRLVRLARSDGAIVGESDVGAPLIATPAVDASSVYVVGMDDRLRALPR